MAVSSDNSNNNKAEQNGSASGGSSSPAKANNSGGTSGRQIPIVCPGHTRPLAELQFCYVKEEDRTFLVSACHDKMPMLRDGTSGDWIGTFAGHKGAVWSCRLDPSGSLAATASGDFSVQVWDAITGASLYQFPHKHIVKTCDFSPNARYLATGGHEGILRVYDLTKAAAPGKGGHAVEPVEIPQDSKEKIVISKCCWLSDDVILAGCNDGVVRFWKLERGQADGTPAAAVPSKPFRTLRTHDGVQIRDMEISHDVPAAKCDVLTAAAGDKVYFFDLSDGRLMHVYKMPVHFREEGGASLHPSGSKFIAGGSDLWVRVFDFETGRELECLKGHHGPIRCLRYSPDGKIYATGSEDGTIRLWKTDPES